jgi:hypothetical protein
VVLVQQNLPFDHFAGGLDYDSSIDGPQNPQYCKTNTTIFLMLLIPDAAGIAAAPRLGATRSRERAISRSLLLVAPSLGAAAMPAASGMSNIKNIVVLVQQNLGFCGPSMLES